MVKGEHGNSDNGGMGSSWDLNSDTRGPGLHELLVHEAKVLAFLCGVIKKCLSMICIATLAVEPLNHY